MRDINKGDKGDGEPQWDLYDDITSTMIEIKFIDYAFEKTDNPILVINEKYHVDVENMLEYSIKNKK